MNRFTVSAEIPAPPQVVYDAWIDGDQHGAMTGSPATASREIGGAFSAHGGYIEGINLELESGRRVLQTWRTTEFADSDSDSSIEITFVPIDAGTLLRLRHWNIPEGQADDYETGWQDFYFTPMSEYFSSL
ncbi:MAG: SRPBCC domain-containing protein [Chloroflexi bacterium]|nr:SRPBCC domain-containing protein [Chloroflexota bacterium]